MPAVIPAAPAPRPDSEIVVMVAQARMPQRCWGGSRYYRVAVVEVDPGAAPRMISARARGVRRVWAVYERCYRGSTDRCAFARAMRAAEECAALLRCEIKGLAIAERIAADHAGTATPPTQ